MNNFLKRFGQFLLFSIVINVLLLVLIVALNRVAVSRCDVGGDIKAVIVGDSHTMWSINDHDIKNVKNISLNAEGYVYTYYKLKRLLDKNEVISHVYLGFGFHNLSGYYDDYISGFQFTNIVHRYLGVMPIRDLIEFVLRNPRDVPEIFKNVVQKGGRAGINQQCILFGSFPDERKMQTFDFSKMKKRIVEQYFDDGQVIHHSESNLEYLQKIVSLLRERNIRLTLLNTPLHVNYVESIPEEYKNEYYNYIDRNQLSVYEFADLHLSNEQFLPDGDHVNYRGAILTTEKFRAFHENQD